MAGIFLHFPFAFVSCSSIWRDRCLGMEQTACDRVDESYSLMVEKQRERRSLVSCGIVDTPSNTWALYSGHLMV